MNSLTIETYAAVFQTIRQWPPDRRFTLVQDVINTLGVDKEIAPPRQNTLSRALGLLATDQPAPSDEEIVGATE